MLSLLEKFSSDAKSKKWLHVANNLIGFSVGAKDSYIHLRNTSAEDFAESVMFFDEAFKGINPSKVNLGKYRRILSRSYIENHEEYSDLDELELIEKFMELTS